MSQVAHSTTEQSSQVPPAIRKFAADHCHGVESIDRYSQENERTGRGWKIRATTFTPKHLPDGFEFGNVTHWPDNMTIQIREE